jgi:hypothetical protein
MYFASQLCIGYVGKSLIQQITPADALQNLPTPNSAQIPARIALDTKLAFHM